LKEKVYCGSGKRGYMEFDALGSKDRKRLLGDANMARGELAGEAVSVFRGGTRLAHR